MFCAFAGRSKHCRRVHPGAVAGFCFFWFVVVSAGSASAGGFFDFLFARFPAPGAAYHAPDPPPAPVALPYADPSASYPQSFESGGTGVAATYCVRLCDGRYFPVQRHSGTTAAQTCQALCPAAKTKVYFGGEIGRASASDGTRYRDLDNAFVYRKRLVDNCTCNGKDAFGLAPIEIVDDPTLRPGDLVATETGLLRFTGTRAQLKKGGGFIEVSTDEPPDARGRVATTSAPPVN